MKKALKTAPVQLKESADYRINPELQGKYDNQPLFQDKIDRANQILKTVGIPKFPVRSK